MRTRKLTVGIAAGLALLTAACGGDDVAGSDPDGRRVEVTMVDTAFEPETLQVAKGEAVRFTFTNDGKIRHEAYVGTPDDQADHGKEMAEGTSSGGHDDDHAGGDDDKISLEPGKRGDLTYRFDEAGTYEIGCHEPGHYAAGMKITVTVT